MVMRAYTMLFCVGLVIVFPLPGAAMENMGKKELVALVSLSWDKNSIVAVVEHNETVSNPHEEKNIDIKQEEALVTQRVKTFCTYFAQKNGILPRKPQSLLELIFSTPKNTVKNGYQSISLYSDTSQTYEGNKVFKNDFFDQSMSLLKTFDHYRNLEQQKSLVKTSFAVEIGWNEIK